MHYSTLVLLELSYLQIASAAVISQRSILQGWSLQASTCPSGSQSCNDGGCCPSGLYCFSAKTAEVASCCTSICVGAVEGSPKCADSSWSLWQGLQGNDFCCQVGLVGVYQSTGTVAGTCVSSGQAGSATTARLVCRPETR
ncbi:hypothetical protein N7509_004515 [Penicillium cosmopolitanum]|uniref:Hydrophobin n=1 Tax=Penicillium cosmopolitanum TaxID=1131564 RepID=A0A9W9W0N1_9EURO|nr:uncharacterized protein N7509_004515 [Penicillium cosmopolitanum]KAJ5396402.1 hypothetical protein N7509_004515 [Penicillium cosmopolitanum]